MSKLQILTMIDYYERKQKITSSFIDLAVIRDTLSLLKKALPTPPRKFYAEGDERVVCPDEECLGGIGASVHLDDNFCPECGQAIEWIDEG